MTEGIVPDSPADVGPGLAAHGYLADDGLCTAVFLAMTLHRPLFLEGEPGVGKTDVARALAEWTGAELIRLLFHEGIDVTQAVYEWDYSRQLLHLRAAETRRATDSLDAVEDELFSERFLVQRPLLRAITVSKSGQAPPVLLIDEIDRADDEFEAFLLELLSDFAVTVPELGSFRAEVPPVVILTSNRTRDVHDALKRRALYHWVEHPGFEREVEIVRLKAPEASERLVRHVTAAVQAMRSMDLFKAPGVAESIDWAHALAALRVEELDTRSVTQTLGAVLKYRDDIERIADEHVTELVESATRHA